MSIGGRSSPKRLSPFLPKRWFLFPGLCCMHPNAGGLASPFIRSIACSVSMEVTWYHIECDISFFFSTSVEFLDQIFDNTDLVLVQRSIRRLALDPDAVVLLHEGIHLEGNSIHDTFVSYFLATHSNSSRSKTLSLLAARMLSEWAPLVTAVWPCSMKHIVFPDFFVSIGRSLSDVSSVSNFFVDVSKTEGTSDESEELHIDPRQTVLATVRAVACAHAY